MTSGSRQSHTMPRASSSAEQHTPARGAAKQSHGELAAALGRRERREDLDALAERVLQQHLEVSGELQRLGAQGIHSRFREDLERSEESREREYGRVAELPALRTGNGHEARPHLEARRLVVPPPSREARTFRVVGVPVVHEAAGDGARSRVQVLVGAPDREIHIPVVQCERHVAGGMREVEPDRNAAPACGPRDALHVVDLAGVVLHARQHDQREVVGVPMDQFFQILHAQARFAGTRSREDEGLARIVAMEAHLRLDGVAIGRKGARLDEHAVTRRRRAIEAHHHQMQIDGERVHADDFTGLGADETGHVRGRELVIGHPRVTRLEVRAHGEAPPVRELLEERGPAVTGWRPREFPHRYTASPAPWTGM